ncbi:O-antigen ligase family protein, partial [Bacillus sp. CGMCC 1.60114]|uniref:O-antigen ligase family protein n=1 Tax=unclassified Bacillus (in: firmicutes) TaxID=185979 RepID=UPI00363FD90F
IKSFKEAPISQKLFGMGYGGNYKENPKLTERDFHDWFYTFGIIGFIFMILPFVYYSFKTLFLIIKNFKQVLTIKYALIATGILLSLGIAFISGHVLTAPAVSIYFSVLLATLIVSLENKQLKINNE